MTGTWRRAAPTPVLVALAVLAAGCGETRAGPGSAGPAARAGIPDSAFAGLVARLSEPGGSFDTDNLVSNETSYLWVLGAMRDLGVQGGAYVGVGPDQSFSYIAATRPQIAFIIDIRRDNLLQHLMFKALFTAAPTRVEYLSLLHGRRPPEDPRAWWSRSIEDVVDYVDGAPRDSAAAERARTVVDSLVGAFGIPLSEVDRRTIRRFHNEFIRLGLDLQYTSLGRRPRSIYPTYRRLLLEEDPEGRHGNYLARRESYTLVRGLELANRIVPVVGDLAGDHALEAIGGEVRRRGLTVSVLYASNVEFYLFRSRTFPAFAANAAGLPMDEHSVLIRSYFPGLQRMGVHPQAVPGHFSTQLLQTLESFRERTLGPGYGRYWDLVTADVLDLRSPSGR